MYCSLWENEALLATQGLGKDKYEIVYPSISILAEPSVAIVDKTVDKNGNRNLAKGYLNYLYSPKGQGWQRNTTSVHVMPKQQQNMRRNSQKSRLLLLIKSLAAGQKRRKPIL